jgi:SAM-dependent methyltransferase
MGQFSLPDEKLRLSRLREALAETSKHSQYQALHPTVLRAVGALDASYSGKLEQERADYMALCYDFSGKTVLDIGANTGYFSFHALQLGATHTVLAEGNAAHVEALSQMIELLDLQRRTSLLAAYYDFKNPGGARYDLGICLNVIHHLGDDFEATMESKEQALQAMASAVQGLSSVCHALFFQMGFNWKGDPDQPLFEHGTKEDVVKFVKGLSDGFWQVRHIAVPDRAELDYRALSEHNSGRFDEVGEFCNRPIFYLESLRLG